MNRDILPCIAPKIEEDKILLPDLNQSFVKGCVNTAIGDVPQVGSSLTRADRFGSFKVRWNIGRGNYKVDPGLYALGMPNEKSPVLVTANYKMSFDHLRVALKSFNAWILVLDTDGVNVWCSAGKKTFGTNELVRRIKSSGIEKVVSQRRVILPQLAGPGIAAHEVRRLSGFKVIYGPIRASDLIAFFKAGQKATKEMRKKSFSLRERLVLIPVELTVAVKWGFLISLGFFLLGGFAGGDWSWTRASENGLFTVPAIFSGIFAGAVLTPLLLPWLPGRPFSLKGFITGVMIVLFLAVFRIQGAETLSSYLEIIAWIFMVPSLSAYLAMNFTGASTYTSLSGVRKEMKWAVPIEIAAGGIGLCIWLGSLLIA